MSRLLLTVLTVLIFVIGGELVYLFFSDNLKIQFCGTSPTSTKVTQLKNKVDSMLGRFSISELYQIMAQVELSKRSTTISSRLVSQYKGRVTSINQGPKSPYYPRVKFTLTEGNDKYFVTYSKEELPNTTIMKKGAQK